MNVRSFPMNSKQIRCDIRGVGLDAGLLVVVLYLKGNN